MSDKIYDHQKREMGYSEKKGFSFYRFMALQNQKGKEYQNESERRWEEKYEEISVMNKVMRMNLIDLRIKLQPFTNDCFNYKDRRITKGGKLWVKEGERSCFDFKA